MARVDDYRIIGMQEEESKVDIVWSSRFNIV